MHNIWADSGAWLSSIRHRDVTVRPFPVYSMPIWRAVASKTNP